MYNVLQTSQEWWSPARGDKRWWNMRSSGGKNFHQFLLNQYLGSWWHTNFHQFSLKPIIWCTLWVCLIFKSFFWMFWRDSKWLGRSPNNTLGISSVKEGQTPPKSAKTPFLALFEEQISVPVNRTVCFDPFPSKGGQIPLRAKSATVYLTSWSNCCFPAFISEVDTKYIFRVLSILSDPFQELYLTCIWPSPFLNGYEKWIEINKAVPFFFQKQMWKNQKSDLAMKDIFSRANRCFHTG